MTLQRDAVSSTRKTSTQQLLESRIIISHQNSLSLTSWYFFFNNEKWTPILAEDERSLREDETVYIRYDALMRYDVATACTEFLRFPLE